MFCVAAGDATRHALKASLALSRADLEYEFSALQRAAEAGAPVVPVVPGSLVHFLDGSGAHRGGGFLLRHVGARAELSSSHSCAGAFAALHALHAAGFAHGDARLPNMVRHGSELLWIDMRDAAVDALAAAQRADARTLAASALRLAQERSTALPASVESAVWEVPAGGGAAYAALAAAVWAALGH